MLPLNARVPSARTIQRWVQAVEHEGVFALQDGRRGRSGGKKGDRLRRKATEELVEEVIKSKKTRLHDDGRDLLHRGAAARRGPWS